MKADLLNSIYEVRPAKNEVLQGSSKTPVGSRIRHGITHISRQLRLSVDRSGEGLQSVIPARSRISSAYCPLVKEKTRRARLNSDAQEVVELTKIIHSKLLLQRGDDTLKQSLTGGGEHNVIDIVQQIGSLIPTAVDEERRVRLC